MARSGRTTGTVSAFRACAVLANFSPDIVGHCKKGERVSITPPPNMNLLARRLMAETTF